jgi:NADH-quinone oxidoreductase subunit M
VLLTVITLFPAVGALLVALYPAKSDRESCYLALSVSAAAFLGSLVLFLNFQSSLPTFRPDDPGSIFQFGLKKPLAWIPSLGVSFQVGLDGISLLLYLLTTLITPLAIFAAQSHIRQRRPFFYSMVLLLETAMLGTLVSLDLILFYVFWEMMLIPMYFIIGIWGGPRRIYATIKFFLFTLAGSLPMFLAILFLYLEYKRQFAAGADSFILEWAKLTQLKLSPDTQMWLFGAFAFSFAVKVPMFPLHTWLPDAHVEAPTSGSIILAALLLKMGGYGFLRFGLPLFPDAVKALSYPLMCLGVSGVIYGALVAMVQEDIKGLIAYSSVSHMAMVMVGVFSLKMSGIQGGLYQMLAHGFSTGALFLLVGMLYDRRHTRLIADFGGIAKVMPWYAAAFLVTTLASIGLPGTTGFVGEFLILLGTFQANPWIALGAGTGIVLGAWYMLRMYRHVFHGKVVHEENQSLPDLTEPEIAVAAPFLLFMILMGVLPQPFLSKTTQSIENLTNLVSKGETGAVPALASGHPVHAVVDDVDGVDGVDALGLALGSLVHSAHSVHSVHPVHLVHPVPFVHPTSPFYQEP